MTGSDDKASNRQNTVHGTSLPPDGQSSDGQSSDGKTGVTTQPAAERAAATSGIVWDDSKMTSFHADVVNLQSTREQVYLFFGTNQSWNLGERKEEPMRVELNSRVILTPHAAKRLLLALSQIVDKYENRFGELKT